MTSSYFITVAKFCEFGKNWLNPCAQTFLLAAVSILLNTWLLLNYYLLNYYHIFKYMWLWYIIVTKWPPRFLLNLDFYITGISIISSTLILTVKCSSCNGKYQMILAEDFSWCVTCHYKNPNQMHLTVNTAWEPALFWAVFAVFILSWWD